MGILSSFFVDDLAIDLGTVNTLVYAPNRGVVLCEPSAVAITAYAKEEDRERALSAGFQIYLAKPVELTELISVVARAAKRDF